MEGLEDRLSQPVAFATVPLDASHKPHMASSSSSSDTDVEANVMRRGKRGTPSKSGQLSCSNHEYPGSKCMNSGPAVSCGYLAVPAS
jgi:hypothetical protein